MFVCFVNNLINCSFYLSTENQIKNLDEDECSFLDLVDKTKIEQQSKINREENKELEEFRYASAPYKCML